MLLNRWGFARCLPYFPSCAFAMLFIRRFTTDSIGQAVDFGTSPPCSFATLYISAQHLYSASTELEHFCSL